VLICGISILVFLETQEMKIDAGIGRFATGSRGAGDMTSEAPPLRKVQVDCLFEGIVVDLGRSLRIVAAHSRKAWSTTTQYPNFCDGLFSLVIYVLRRKQSLTR
jgi:hypothetical protein